MLKWMLYRYVHSAISPADNQSLTTHSDGTRTYKTTILTTRVFVVSTDKRLWIWEFHCVQISKLWYHFALIYWTVLCCEGKKISYTISYHIVSWFTAREVARRLHEPTIIITNSGLGLPKLLWEFIWSAHTIVSHSGQMDALKMACQMSTAQKIIILFLGINCPK